MATQNNHGLRGRYGQFATTQKYIVQNAILQGQCGQSSALTWGISDVSEIDCVGASGGLRSLKLGRFDLANGRRGGNKLKFPELLYLSSKRVFGERPTVEFLICCLSVA